MGLKPDFKQSQAGPIPEDWAVTTLGEMCSAVLDCHHSTPVWTKSGSVVIRNQNIRDGKLSLADPSFTDERHFAERTRRAVPTFGDLVITREAPMGSVCMIPQDLKCCLGQRMVLLRPRSDAADTRFLLYALLSEPVQRAIAVAGGTGSTVSNLRIPALKELRILSPERFEQRAIAEALFEVDELVAALDRLIAKKRDLKRAAMHQLLTCQTRLPGFHGDWEVKVLGNVADVIKGTGLSKTAISPSGSRKCILYGELFTTYGRVIRDVLSRTEARDGQLGQVGDVLMPGSTTTIGIDLAIASALLTEGVSLGGDINIIRRKGTQQYDPAFLANYLTEVKRQDIADQTQGITIIHLYGRALLALPLRLPPVPEQIAIAGVLGEMDAELSALVQQREKTTCLKQGMMQELLTGRNRLV